MGVTVCQCNTYSGLIPQTSHRTGRKLKSKVCKNHTAPLRECDVCGISSFFGGSQFDDGWDMVNTGRTGTPEGYREGYITNLQVLCCTTCLKEIQQSQQIAFDAVLERHK